MVNTVMVNRSTTYKKGKVLSLKEIQWNIEVHFS